MSHSKAPSYLAEVDRLRITTQQPPSRLKSEPSLLASISYLTRNQQRQISASNSYLGPESVDEREKKTILRDPYLQSKAAPAKLTKYGRFRVEDLSTTEFGTQCNEESFSEAALLASSAVPEATPQVKPDTAKEKLRTNRAKTVLGRVQNTSEEMEERKSRISKADLDSSPFAVSSPFKATARISRSLTRVFSSSPGTSAKEDDEAAGAPVTPSKTAISDRLASGLTSLPSFSFGALKSPSFGTSKSPDAAEKQDGEITQEGEAPTKSIFNSPVKVLAGSGFQVPFFMRKEQESAPEGAEGEQYALNDDDDEIIGNLKKREATIRKIHKETLYETEWVIWIKKTRTVMEGKPFNLFIFCVIILAAILAGFEVYYPPEEDSRTFALGILIKLVFTIEIGLRVYSGGPLKPSNEEYRRLVASGQAEGVEQVLMKSEPLNHFRDMWNTFDAVVTLLSWASDFVGPVIIFRSFRLLVLVKQFAEIQQLQILLGAFILGIQSVGYIFLLLFILLYMFAVVGMFFFRDNDPIHYSSLGLSIESILRIATLENWTRIMYTNMYGCDEYGYLAECTAPHVLNSTIPEDLDWPCPENCFTNCCIKPIAAYYSSLFYHFGLVVTVGFVGLSLFVGVLTTAMDECTAEWRSDEKFERKFRLNNCDQALDDAQIHHIKATITGIDERRFFMERAEMPEWTKKYIKHPMLQMYFKAYLLSTVKIDYFVEQNAIFNHSVTVAIIIGGILVGVNTDESLAGASWLVALDNLIMIVFIVELLLKIYGKGLKPWTYFDNLWNCYDFLVVVAAMIPPEAMGSTSAGANPATCLRLFRLVRILRVIRKLKRLQVIIQGMVHGLGSMALLPVLLIIVYYIFAVVGIWAFRKNDPWHFTGIGTAIVTLFRCSTFEDWTDVMYINQYGCDAYPHDSLTPGEGTSSPPQLPPHEGLLARGVGAAQPALAAATGGLSPLTAARRLL
ncbi:hypothetical protein CYMTET_23788 [Cymbomonas tetramitiformis]|uniref:Ion transport domain-containing protein n=1 Tax=Cymbomonas tetramitiformis TaxID=36881 RepID=A0AAE0FXQ0_9CHLO|nr:hypothetical protein CYMTET_23788 [Cymbomonas tetramitiformis]